MDDSDVFGRECKYCSAATLGRDSGHDVGGDEAYDVLLSTPRDTVPFGMTDPLHPTSFFSGALEV